MRNIVNGAALRALSFTLLIAAIFAGCEGQSRQTFSAAPVGAPGEKPWQRMPSTVGVVLCANAEKFVAANPGDRSIAANLGKELGGTPAMELLESFGFDPSGQVGDLAAGVARPFVGMEPNPAAKWLLIAKLPVDFDRLSKAAAERGTVSLRGEELEGLLKTLVRASGTSRAVPDMERSFMKAQFSLAEMGDVPALEISFDLRGPGGTRDSLAGTVWAAKRGGFFHVSNGKSLLESALSMEPGSPHALVAQPAWKESLRGLDREAPLWAFAHGLPFPWFYRATAHMSEGPFRFQIALGTRSLRAAEKMVAAYDGLFDSKEFSQIRAVFPELDLVRSNVKVEPEAETVYVVGEFSDADLKKLGQGVDKVKGMARMAGY